MKVGMGLLNVPTVADSAGNHVNPSWVGMVDPAGRWRPIIYMTFVRLAVLLLPFAYLALL
jgi:hypothetical protein